MADWEDNGKNEEGVGFAPKSRYNSGNNSGGYGNGRENGDDYNDADRENHPRFDSESRGGRFGGRGGRGRSSSRGDFNGREEGSYKPRRNDDYDRRDQENTDEDGGYGGRRRRDDGDGRRRDDGDGRRRFGGQDRENRNGWDQRRGDRDNDGDRDERGGGGLKHQGDGEKPREFYIPPEPTDNESELFGGGISSGINFDKYEKIPIKVSGNEPAKAINSFSDAGFRDLVLTNIKKSNYTVPTPIQKTSIPIIMDGRDLMACAQTGSGKTAAFLLPIVNNLLQNNEALVIKKPQVLIISPTRELSRQIFDEARKFAHGSYIKVNIVYGGTSSKHQLENMMRGCHILIATVGRLMDFLNNGHISFEEVKFLVLDEADRMLDMGFRDEIHQIMEHRTMRSKDQRQILMFSATFPTEIQQLASKYLVNYIFVAIGVVGGACTDVVQSVIEVAKHEKRTKLMELLHESADGTIVFVETKRGADFLASLLSESEFPTTSIHGDRFQSQREKALCDFRAGRMKVLIATSVAARGLDIKNISHVINYDLPKDIDEYVHRIGRTGRVGNNGRATSFFDPVFDTSLAPDLVNVLQGAGQDVPAFLLELGGGGVTSFDNDGREGNEFSSRDVRRGVNCANYNAEPAALEADECWD